MNSAQVAGEEQSARAAEIPASPTVISTCVNVSLEVSRAHLERGCGEGVEAGQRRRVRRG